MSQKPYESLELKTRAIRNYLPSTHHPTALCSSLHANCVGVLRTIPSFSDSVGES